MFGLKIVKSQEYADLKWRLEQTWALVEENNKRIDELNETIREKDEEINRLKKTKKNVKTSDTKNVILLTDVAETPLLEETKSDGKPKRVVKKTNKSKNQQKRVVHRTDEI